ALQGGHRGRSVRRQARRAAPPAGLSHARPADAADPCAGPAHLHAGGMGPGRRRTGFADLPRRQQARPGRQLRRVRRVETPAPPVTNERGERLIAFHAAQGPAPPTTTDFALALSARQSNVLLVRSTHRGVWELPGGWVEPDESALDCALRELQEE